MRGLKRLVGQKIGRRRSWAAMVFALAVALIMNAQGALAEAVWWVTAMSTQSQTTQVGTTFSEPFSVKLSCISVDNCLPVSGVDVTFTASTATSGASGTFATTGTNTVTVVTNGSGIATAPAFTANSITGTYVVEARAAEPDPTSAIPNVFSLTNSANAATLAASISTGDGSNQSALINTTYATQFSVAVFNGFGQLLPGVTVTFTAPGSGASGTFSSTGTNVTTAITGATGVATASTFTANGTGGSYFVDATVSGSQTATGEALSTSFAVKNTISNVIGVPDLVGASAGNLQGVGVLTTLPINLQVVVLDGNLDYVPDATVVFTAPSSGPSGTFAGGTTTYTTTSGATGLATASAFTTNAEVGQIQISVVATKGGVSASTNLGVINGKVDTTTTLAVSPNGSSVYGQPVVLTATVLPIRGTYVPTGAVAFKLNGTAIDECASVVPSGGVATCTLSGLDNTDENTWLTPGTYSFSAEYAGDAGSYPSSSTTVSHTVTKAGTTITLVTSHPTFALQGESVTFTAILSPVAPGRGTFSGGVTFTSTDGTQLNAGNPVSVVDGVAQVSTTTLTPGMHTITATYGSDTNFVSSTGSLSQNVYTIPEVTQDPVGVQVLAGELVTFTAAATGVPAPSVQWQVSFDGGTSFDDISGAIAATLSFFPTGADDQNQYRAVFTNPAGSDTTAAATLTVRVPPSFTSSNAATFTVGVDGSFTVTADGILAPTLSLTSGTLPDGVTFDEATGILSGTPATATGGAYSLVFTATNGTDPDATQAFTLTVQEAPEITSFNTATFTAGTAGSFTLTASGYPTPAFSVTGPLPAGVTFNSGNMISGIATETGTFALTIGASNGVLPDASQTFTLVVLMADQNPLLLSVTPDEGVFGDKLTPTVSGGSGSGQVLLDLGASTACERGTGVDADKLLITSGVGTCEVTATKAASEYFKSATSNTVIVTVGKAATGIQAAALTGTFDGTISLVGTLTWNGTPLSGRQIDFALNYTYVGMAVTDASGVATLANVSLSGIDAGSYPGGIAVHFAGDASYQEIAGAADLTVEKAAGAVSITNVPASAYVGSSFTPTYDVLGNGVVSVVSLSVGVCTINDDDVQFIGAGTCELQAIAAEGDNHLAATGPIQSVTVKSLPTIALSTTSSGFNGWVTATLADFAPDTNVTLTWDDAQTIGGATTDGAGGATISFRTPLDVFGAHTVTASDGTMDADATLSITTRIKLTTTEGPVGTVTRVYLYGYAAGDQVAIRFFSATGRSAQVIKTLTIADNGRATALITVPKTTVMGPRKVSGYVFENGRTAVTIFTVTPKVTTTQVASIAQLTDEASVGVPHETVPAVTGADGTGDDTVQSLAATRQPASTES